jgi:hypothetical protein
MGAQYVVTPAVCSQRRDGNGAQERIDWEAQQFNVY